MFSSGALFGQNSYYFSSVSGNDAAAGTSASAPWKSVDKLKTLLPSLQPGDKVYLERGSSWYEVELQLINKSGSASNPITFLAYGSGPRPILSGGVVISNFSKNGNIYNATVPKDFNSEKVRVPAGILINGSWKDIARSQEFFTLGTNSYTTLFDNKQSWGTNSLAGGFLLAQPVQWQWNPAKILSNTSSSITFQPFEFPLPSNSYFAYYLANLDGYLQSSLSHIHDLALLLYARQPGCHWPQYEAGFLNPFQRPCVLY